LLTVVLFRREIHEIEERKRARQKKQQARAKQEENDRQERMFQIMSQSQNPMMAYGMQNGMQNGMMPNMPNWMPQGPGQQRQASPQADQSGNPYAPRSGR